jgi:serine/threonine protein kinase
MTTISDYRMIKKIGTGGFSKVMLGENLHTGEKVALKIMKNSNTKQGAQRKDLYNAEVTAMKELDHPNLIKLKD